MHLGFHPMHGKRHEPNTVMGVEALDRFHQTDVAFLNEIGQWQSVATIGSRDVDHESQMREHQLTSSIELTVFMVANGQVTLFFSAEDRDTIDSLNIAFEIANRGQQIYWL